MSDTQQPVLFSFQGQLYHSITIPATGEWQLLQLKSKRCYILVHPNGRQAWFHEEQINEIVANNPKFRYTSHPLRDLQKLARLGLLPFHVDDDFDPTPLLVNDLNG